jgi:hypothetical protein
MKIVKRLCGFFKKEYQNDISLKIKISLFFVLLMLAIFAFLRVLFCIEYGAFFAEIGFAEKIKYFIFGMRFDMASIGIFLGYFIVLMFLPVGAGQKIIIKILVLCMTVSVFCQTLLLFGDFFYFIEAKRHMSEELLLAWKERDFIISYALHNYWAIILAVAVLTAVCIKFSFNFINKNMDNKRPAKAKLYKSLAVFFACGRAFSFVYKRENF